MEREGYRNISDREAELYGIVGTKLFFKMMEGAFRIGYWIEKRTEPYTKEERDACYLRTRQRMVDEGLKLIADDKQDYLELLVLSDSEIVHNINQEENRQIQARKKPVLLKKAD